MTSSRVNPNDQNDKGLFLLIHLIQSKIKLSSKERAIRIHLERGADVNKQDHQKRTPLIFACQEQPELVKILIENGAQIDLRCQEGMTPLMHLLNTWILIPWMLYPSSFSKEKSKTIVETITLLLSHGADPTEKIFNGKTFLEMLSKRYFTRETITLLIYPVLCNFATFGFSVPNFLFLSEEQNDYLACLYHDTALRQSLHRPVHG